MVWDTSAPELLPAAVLLPKAMLIPLPFNPRALCEEYTRLALGVLGEVGCTLQILTSFRSLQLEVLHQSRVRPWSPLPQRVPPRPGP
jgi:hypothetical protein